MDPPRDPSRRKFFRIAGAGGIAWGLPVGARAAEAAPPAAYTFFTPAEAAFIEAAVARLIPRDALGPGALEAGVPHFLDRQLAGAWGAGERLYRAGPWHEGKETQGYQLPFTPAQLFRHALRAIEADLAPRGGFAALDAAAQDEYLRALEKGEVRLSPVPADTFFAMLRGGTIEGFFSDPVHGGNRDMVGWRMIGFPGAYSYYYDLVDRYGAAFRPAPLSLAEGAPHAQREPHAGPHGGGR